VKGSGANDKSVVTADGLLIYINHGTKKILFQSAGVSSATKRKTREGMSRLIDLMPILFVIFGAATLVLVFALLIYSIMVSDSDFANRKTSILIFRLLILSALAAVGFGFASILMILLEKHAPAL
jgi:hypothetical protein